MKENMQPFCHTLNFQINQKPLKFKTFDFKTIKIYLSLFRNKLGFRDIMFFQKHFQNCMQNIHHDLFDLLECKYFNLNLI